MSDIVKGALGGAWTLIVGWILPTSVVVAVFGVVVLPSLDRVSGFEEVASGTSTDRALTLLVVSVLLGWAISCLQTPLYRVLEGYLGWPQKLVLSGIRRHQQRYDTLRRELFATHEGLPQAFVLERFSRYPPTMAQIAPTQLGNAIRRFEYYGADRYQLDSQTLWEQLRASVPESLTKDIDAARAAVDFFVCLIYLSALAGVASVASISADPDRWPVLLVTAAAAPAVMWISYRSAVISTDSWAAGVRALVDIGRRPLAASLGLVVPAHLEDERRMWKVVGDMSIFPFHDRLAAELDEFRVDDARG